MKRRSLTLGLKIALSTGTLVAVLLLLAADGLRSISLLRDSFNEVADKTTRQLILAGKINAAESDMAAAQRGVVLFTYAKDPANAAPARNCSVRASPCCGSRFPNSGLSSMMNVRRRWRPTSNRERRYGLRASLIWCG